MRETGMCVLSTRRPAKLVSKRFSPGIPASHPRARSFHCVEIPRKPPHQDKQQAPQKKTPRKSTVSTRRPQPQPPTPGDPLFFFVCFFLLFFFFLSLGRRKYTTRNPPLTAQQPTFHHSENLCLMSTEDGMFLRQRSYQRECTGSRPITEVKRVWARLVLPWVTRRES